MIGNEITVNISTVAYLILFIYISKRRIKNLEKQEQSLHGGSLDVKDKVVWNIRHRQCQHVKSRQSGGKFCFGLLDLIIRVGFMNNIYCTRMSAARVMDYLDPQMLWKMLIRLVQAHCSIESLQFHFNFILYKTDSTLFMELKNNSVRLLAEFPSVFDY